MWTMNKTKDGVTENILTHHDTKSTTVNDKLHDIGRALWFIYLIW